MRQRYKRAAALLLALALAWGMVLPVWAAEPEPVGETLALHTTEDLLALRERCIVDTATRDLTVRLEADLDLTGTDFAGLPVFSGRFDGQGFCISGLSLTGGTAVQGFFRYLEADAVVENLTLEGTVGSDQADVQGLLAGSNRGLIRNCTVSGRVTASQEAGGLAGRNEAEGQIINCCSRASVQADRMAGGVTGQNLGALVRCRNEGEVNTALAQSANRLTGLNLTGEDGASLEAVSDIGGIAGRAAGIVQSCTNAGSVGYPSVGSNVGGVVGRLSGYLDGCTNEGTVQGSEDVGGVAGQLEPLLEVQYDAGKLDTLYNELDALQDRMDGLLNDMDASGDSVSGALSALTDAARSAKNSTGALADSLTDWADEGLGAVQSVAGRFAWAIDRLDPVLDNVETALAQGDAAGAALDRLLQDAALDGTVSGQVKADLQDAAAAFARARQQTRTAWEQAKAALQKLADALGDDSESAAAWRELAEALAELQTAAGQMQDAVETLDSLLTSLAGDNGTELDALRTDLERCRTAREAMDGARQTIRAQLAAEDPDWTAVSDAAQSGLEAAGQAAEAAEALGTDLDALAGSLSDEELAELRRQSEAILAGAEAFGEAAARVREAAQALPGWSQTAETALTAAWEELCAAADSLDAAGTSLNEGLDALTAAADKLGPALEEAGEALPGDVTALRQALHRAAQAARQAVTGINEITTGLAGQSTVRVSSLDSAVGEKGDALDASLSALLDGFSSLNTVVNAAGDTLTADLRAVNAQMGRVVDAMRGLTDGTTGEDRFADVSREQAEQQLQDRADGCLVNAANSGAVTGDSRVGGIAGSLANELDTDPEGHWQQEGSGSALTAEVQLRLILLDCRNTGTVTAKKEAAGGVVGRMDFGYAAGCENCGDVTGSDTVGGVAGRNRGVLENCWVRCALTGGSYVGGIAGEGSDIRDCRTMVELLPAEEGTPIDYAGTIAGKAEEDAVLTGNRYISDSLGAVDGVTRAAQALPADFETLASDPAAPDGFARLELTFVADGKTVATVYFRYGEGVDALPAVPAKSGYIGQWPDLDYTHLTYSRTVEAEYIPYTSALADGSGETPQILVDGSFSPQATVDTRTEEVTFTDGDGRTHSGTAYTVTVTDPMFGAPDCTVHFRKPETAARYTLWVRQGDTWVQQKPGVDGSYLLIDCPGGQITFVAEQTVANVWRVLLAAAGILLAAALFVALWFQRHKKPAPPAPEEKQTA